MLRVTLNMSIRGATRLKKLAAQARSYNSSKISSDSISKRRKVVALTN